MTEDDADTMRCCGPEGCGERRIAQTPLLDDSEMPDANAPRYCIGPACMAWRWSMASQIGTHGAAWEKGKLVWPDAENAKQSKVSLPSSQGYCGYAGPQ